MSSFVLPKYPNTTLGGTYAPPTESLLTAYARALADADRKPRSRSE